MKIPSVFVTQEELDLIPIVKNREEARADKDIVSRFRILDAGQKRWVTMVKGDMVNLRIHDPRSRNRNLKSYGYKNRNFNGHTFSLSGSVYRRDKKGALSLLNDDDAKVQKDLLHQHIKRVSDIKKEEKKS